jgi:coenzyme PQQ synthesis protein D (PqqD)
MHDSESWAAVASVTAATAHGETVLFDRAGGHYVALNETGGVIWRLVRRPGGATIDEIVRALDAEYEAPSLEQLRADAVALLGRLKRDRLVVRA